MVGFVTLDNLGVGVRKFELACMVQEIISLYHFAHNIFLFFPLFPLISTDAEPAPILCEVTKRFLAKLKFP